MTDTSETDRIRRVYDSYKERDLRHRIWSELNPGNQSIEYERGQTLKRILQDAGISHYDDLKILDVGCGSGKVLAQFMKWGASPENLYGIDLLSDRIAEAKQNYKDIFFQTTNAEKIKFDDCFFDLVLLYTIFSSIFDRKMIMNISEEIRRVLKLGGMVVWYDFRYNNPWNSNVHRMGLKDIHMLFPEFKFKLRKVTVLPFLVRRMGRYTQFFYPILARIALLKTHYLGVLVKPI